MNTFETPCEVCKKPHMLSSKFCSDECHDLTKTNAYHMSGWTKHTAHHWSRLLDGYRMDYYPTTGRVMWRGSNWKETPWATAELINAHSVEPRG